jgi:hypothetical protein
VKFLSYRAVNPAKIFVEYLRGQLPEESKGSEEKASAGKYDCHPRASREVPGTPFIPGGRGGGL